MDNRSDGASSLAIDSFLKELSEISYRHGLAIGDRGEVFLMEEDDYESRYYLQSGDYLGFGA